MVLGACAQVRPPHLPRKKDSKEGNRQKHHSWVSWMRGARSMRAV
jgi:hypothetical protein